MTAPQFFPHQLTENCKLLQKAALLRREGNQIQVLILKRAADSISRPNCWDLPGGNSNWPVDLTDSAANLHYADLLREIEEETALIVPREVVDFKNLVYFSSYFDYQKQIFTLITGWMIDFSLCQATDIKISAEHQESAWVGLDELENYDFAGEKGQFIVDIIKQAFQKFA